MSYLIIIEKMDNIKFIETIIQNNYKYGGLEIEDIKLSYKTLTHILNKVNCNLLRLKLINCNIKSLPNTCFLNFNQIHLIDISNNNLTSLDFNIKKLNTLKTLIIRKNKLEILPANINYLNLEELDISNNEIKEINFDKIYFKKLKYLDVSNNKGLKIIGRFPKTLFHLHLNGLQLNKMPQRIRYLTNLKTLYLGENNISYLSNYINELKELEILDISHNNFKKFPAPLLKNKNIKDLYLDYNKISVIPNNIYEMKSLKHLYLINNNVKKIYHLDSNRSIRYYV